MPPAPFVEFSHLWKEEQAHLSQLAGAVAAGGTVVEIGTDFGGGALLMQGASAGKDVSIHTVDIDPAPQARSNLKDTGVEIIAMPSDRAAIMWRERGGKPVDLLFIDGGHDLGTVFGDVNAWFPHVKPGGTVVFHDYDPPRRGGAKHLGVQVCVDAVRMAGLLQDTHQEARLYCGTVAAGRERRITAEDCWNSLNAIADRVRRLRGADFSRWTVAADARFAALLKTCLRIAPDAECIDPRRFTGRPGPCLVSAQPEGLPPAVDGVERLVIDSLTACTLLDHARHAHANRLKGLTADRREFALWQEVLEMDELAHGRSAFPDDIASVPRDRIEPLARVVAREQVRLTMLSRMLQTFVDWTP